MNKEKEEWRDVIGYEGHYKISNKGNVYSVKSSKLLKLSSNGRYSFVSLCLNGECKHTGIANIVALHFVPNPDNKPCVNHINGVKDDNSSTNLEWCTTKENNAHARRERLWNMYGENCHLSRLTYEDVLVIRSLNGIMPNFLIAEYFGVHRDTVCNILRKKSWRHGEIDIKLPQSSNRNYK